VFLLAAEGFGIPVQDIRQLWDHDAQDAAHQIREIYADSGLVHLHALTGYQSTDLFAWPLQSRMWKTFLRLIEDDPRAVLALTIKGLGLWVITLQPPTDTCPGRLRAIIPSTGTEDAYIMPFDLFLTEYQNG